MSKNFKTKELFSETLKRMGCQYEIDENGRIDFYWQGGYFIAEVGDDSPFIVVWYPQWADFDLNDVEALSRTRTVINQANISHGVTIVYSINNEEGTFSLHTKKHFLFYSEISKIDEYLNAILGQFFVNRHYVENELARLKMEEEKVMI